MNLSLKTQTLDANFHFGITMATALGLLSGVATSQASVIASDNFDSYTAAAANLGGQGAAGSGWSAGWTSPTGTAGFTTAKVSDYSGDQMVDVAITNTSSQVAAGRVLSTPLASTFYVTYTAQSTGPNSFGVSNTFGLVLSDLTVPSATVGANVLNFGMRSSTAAADFSNGAGFAVRAATGSLTTALGYTASSTTGTTAAVAAGNVYKLVAKLTYSGGTFDQIDMWVNPADGAPDSLTPDATYNIFNNPVTGNTGNQTVLHGVTAVNSVYFRQAANQTDDTYRFDDLILGTAWVDVVPVPEPSAAILLGLTSLSLIGYRRRR